MTCATTNSWGITLQDQLKETYKWMTKWRIKVNVQKSIHLTFTLRCSVLPLLKIERSNVQQTSSFKYLGEYLDSRLVWENHIKAKRKQLDIDRRNLFDLVAVFYFIKWLLNWSGLSNVGSTVKCGERPVIWIWK